MLELEFDKPIAASDRVKRSRGSWSGWFDELPREPRWVGLWSGPEVSGRNQAGYRIGGYFVEPLESVVGLSPFDDALEGVVGLEGVDEPVPYVLFEVEKVARMMLHQSALALEVLSTPYWLRTPSPEEPCDEPRGIVRRALTAGIGTAYRERAADRLDGELSDDALREVTRRLATAVGLRESRLSLDLDRLLECFDRERPGLDWRGFAAELAGELDRLGEVLPESAPDYEGLSEWLIELRLAHCGRNRD